MMENKKDIENKTIGMESNKIEIDIKKSGISFLILFIALVISLVLQGGYQNDWGNIDVDTVRIRSYNGQTLVGKLYRPIQANSTNPLPGVLAVHGYNNDKDVQRPNALELSKRGIVVLAIDVAYHGDSEVGVGSYIPNEAYEWLRDQAFVNASLTGVVGHSLGAGIALTIALTHPEIDVLGYQAFGPDNLTPYIATLANMSTNVIQIWSAFEEFGSRQYNQTVEQWYNYGIQSITTNIETTGVGAGPGEPDKTYGSFALGNAQRYEYIVKTHPGQTHDLEATKAIIAFFLQALTGVSESTAEQSAVSTTYIDADFWGAFSALMLMLSIIPLVSIILKSPQFKEVNRQMPSINEGTKLPGWVWWLFATVNFIIGGITYALDTSGPTDIDWIIDGGTLREWFPWMTMTIFNGFSAFYLVNAIINVIFILIWFFAFARGKGDTSISYDIGMSYDEKKFQINWSTFLKTILLAAIVFLYMYGITAFARWYWVIEIRGPWSMFRIFTISRAGLFWIYLWFPLAFWLFNGGIWLFGLMRQKEYGSEAKTILIWWLKACFAMLPGLIILNLISYFPMWIGLTGPYLNQYNFAPMMLLQTWAAIPIMAVMLLISVFYYRRTGKVYLGAIIMAVMVTWFLSTGTINF